RIAQLRPARFVVRLDGRLVLRQRQLEPHIRVHVAVGEMMHHLLDAPAAVAIRSRKLLARQSLHRRALLLRRFFHLRDQFPPVVLGRRRVRLKFSYRIPPFCVAPSFPLSAATKFIPCSPYTLRSTPSESLPACLRSTAPGRP